METTNNQRRLLPRVFLSVLFVASVGLVFWTTSKAFTSVMQDTLRRSTESSHGDMVLFASSALQKEIIELIDLYEEAQPVDDWEAFAKSDRFVAFDQQVRELFFRTNVLKLKVYASDGYTVFSTDPDQIGQEKSEVEEVTHALRGRSSSQFSFRENFMTLVGNKSNLEVVSSYHPLTTRGGLIRGVVEVYSDRSKDFLNAEDLVTNKLSQLVLALSLVISTWLISLIYHSLQRREEDF